MPTWLFAILFRVVQRMQRDRARYRARIERYSQTRVGTRTESHGERSDTARYLRGLLARLDEAKRVVVTNEVDYPCDSEIGCIVSNADDITAIAADDSNVYWTEHGTVDYLGNYLNDGRLLKRAFDSETTEVVATGLSGPVGLMLTTTDAYIYLDEFFQGSIRNALTRLPLTGGDATIVQLDIQPSTGYGAPGEASFTSGRRRLSSSRRRVPNPRSRC